MNWTLCTDGDGITLIDGGYPKNAADVVASIREIGRRPEEIRGALLTHAHVDHIGGLSKLAKQYGFPVFVDPAEVPHAHRDYLQQITPIAIVKNLHKHGTLGWVAGIIPLGALDRNVAITDAAAFPSSPLDLPGAPKPVASHGHTDGHSSYLINDGEILVSGDALITGHATSAVVGPQMLIDPFHHDLQAARASAARLGDISATTIWPGHGEPVHMPLDQAVDQALHR